MGRVSCLQSNRVSQRKLSIGIVSTKAGSSSGNAVTSRRWQAILRELGHRVSLAGGVDDLEAFDLLIVLHALRGAAPLAAFAGRFPDRPRILALTGTDLYGDLSRDPVALRSLELADRYVVLQPLGLRQLPAALRERAVAIYQSAERYEASVVDADRFDVCVLAHLRQVKDPLLAAVAVRQLPAESKIRVLHAGAALDEKLATQAREEARTNRRYEWLGELDREQALRRLAASRLLVLTSKLEGGANVLTEAIAAGVPIVSSRIDGSIGILGERYPGYFSTGDSRGLADLLLRLERDSEFYAELRGHVAQLAELTGPEREMRAWERLLAGLN